MKTVKEVKEYALAAKDWIYVWGANGEKITQKLMDRLYRDYGSANYPKSYYEKKLAEGAGRMAADCSGFLRQLSGYDDTAQGYYNSSSEKGTIESLPRKDLVLVYKRNSSERMYHVGIYLGDGTVVEMASSTANYKHKPVDGGGWTHWGRPKWIEYKVNQNECILDLSVELPSLVKGHKCGYVLTLQRLLASKGYDTNGVDGIFGSGTEQAVAKFQKDNSVSVNYPGTVGAKTWMALLKG